MVFSIYKDILLQPAKKNVFLPGICTGERELEGQLRMDNPLATLDTRHRMKKKQNKHNTEN